jgi:hypothetical protein
VTADARVHVRAATPLARPRGGRAGHRRGGVAARLPIAAVVRALLDRDFVRTCALAEQVLATTGSRLAVMADLLHPAQVELENLWYAGAVSARDQTDAAVLVRRVLSLLPSTPSRHQIPGRPRCVVAALPGGDRDPGLGMLELALQDDGWDVEVIQPGTPPSDRERGPRRPPRLTVLWAGAAAPPAGRLAQTVAGFRRFAAPVLVGGAAFSRTANLAERVGADAFAADPRAGCVIAWRLART